MFCIAIAIQTQAATNSAKSGNPAYQGLSIFQQTHTVKVLGRNMTVTFTDTLSYLKTNFDTNKAFYIGKPVSTLLGDLELQVRSNDVTPNIDAGTIIDFSLLFISTTESFRRRENNGKIVYVQITFNQPVLESDLDVLYGQVRATYPNNIFDWNPLDATFYGSRIIKDIQVYQVDFSQQ